MSNTKNLINKKAINKLKSLANDITILCKTIIEELWTLVAKILFKEGKEDPNISIIKVTPTTALLLG